MTVKELRDILDMLHEDWEVYDAEGNDIAIYCSVSGKYITISDKVEE